MHDFWTKWNPAIWGFNLGSWIWILIDPTVSTGKRCVAALFVIMAVIYFTMYAIP